IIRIALTLPISSAAICHSIGLIGLAGGAAVAGCCAQMVGFAVMSYRENKVGGLVSQGIGTSMLQMGNIAKKPVIWLPPIIASAITGPIATCLFKLRMDGPAISSGMGTCGFVGQIGVITGWNGSAGWIDWVGLLLISFVLPAILCFVLGRIFRAAGIIKDGDLKLED
ncbi:MAG: PTS sugar transporter subunit IIC, partial [Lachnospiraceae bacterium]|nr:PTS sugar transporter subunit IIC [Lachnospiraceae bacterium]